MTHTPNLVLPYLQPAQALKYVTHNEALLRLDRITQLSVITRLSSPPTASEKGDRYLIDQNPSGDWDGFPGYIAELISHNEWHFLKPLEGWICSILDQRQLYQYVDGAWHALSDNLQRTPYLGINAQADDLNRLLIRSNTTLFDNEGGDHILKINKSESSATASLQFQKEYSSFAEIGLTGNDDLTIKVRSDASNLEQALTIETETADTKCRNLYSGEIYLLNDTAKSITPPKAGGFLMIMMDDPIYPQISHSAILAYDVGVSPNILILSGGPNIAVTNNIPLTGTSGAEKFTTVSVMQGELMIENRYGTHKTYRYTFLG